MKKFLSLIVMLVTSITIHAIPVKYTGCVPDNGSSISSFDFTLNFDISEAVADLGTGEWGIGYIGNISSGRYATLYEGNQDEGVELATALTENFSGKSEGFVVNGSTINIKFPITLKPEIGKTYTLVIKNFFAVFQLGKPTPKSSTYLKFEAEPLILTFVGASPSSAELLLQDVSVAEGTRLNTLKEVSFSFNEDIDLTDNAKVSILEGTQTVYQSSDISVAADNAKILCVKFSDDMELYNAHNYKLYLPAGTVALASDNSVLNKEHVVNIEGSAYKYYTVKSTLPTDGTIGLFSSVKISYNIPAGSKISEEGIYWDRSLKMYKDAVSEENLVTTLWGTPSSDNAGIEWNLSNYSLEPSTNYILHRAEGLGKLFSGTEYLSEWTNEESIIHVSTPSIEESGFPPIELGEPIIGNHDGGGRILKDGDSIDYLDLIEIAPVDYFYKGKEGTSNFRLAEDSHNHIGYLYDITTGTPELIKEVSLSCVQRETSMFYYSVISAPLKNVFFEGHRYRFVIPKGEFTILYPEYYNFVRTPEYSIEFEGTTPTEVNLLSCTLQEGEERSALGNVVWTFKGKFELNPEAEAILSRTGTTYKWLLTSSLNASDNTRVVAHIYSESTGESLRLSKNQEWTLTLPEGTVYYQADPTIKNKEIAISFKGIDAKPEVQEPEFVNVEVCIEGVHTTTSEAVKGRKLTLTLTPDEFWEVEKLMRDGDDVSPKLEDGRYTTPALNADTRIEAALKCKANVLLNETATSVMEIPDSNVKVYSDGTHIIVEGLNVGDMVAVYTVNGMLITSQEMTTADHNMQITADTGVVYIVRVNDKAVKIQH